MTVADNPVTEVPTTGSAVPAESEPDATAATGEGEPVATAATGEGEPVATASEAQEPVSGSGRTLLVKVGRVLWRAVRAQSLTAPAGVLIALGLMLPGVLVDLVTDATVGLPTSLSFVAAAVVPALVVRTRSMGTAVVLPPLLYAGALGVLARFGGQNQNLRQVVLDTGTMLALGAPTLFAVTALTGAVVLGRLLWRLTTRLVAR